MKCPHVCGIIIEEIVLMFEADEINDFLDSIGLPADTCICFESLYDLNRAGIVSDIEIKNVKNITDWYGLVMTVNIRSLMMHMENGVRFLTFDGVLVSPFAKIGKNTVLHPNTEIRKNVEIGENCDIGPCSVLSGSRVGNNCTVNATQMYDSVMDDNVKIGPFSHIRPNSHLCEGAKIGDFVEIKNSTIGKDSHASHLTYIGDSDVGERVNFGCGTVTSNYNGYSKARCRIGDDAFVGCNTNLIAPVTVGKGAYTAAGSTINKDVPDGALGIARERQTNKEGWADRFRELNKKK